MKKMDLNQIKAVYFVGAGGIGMSALIRYFLYQGKQVAGYDKTPSDLTEQLNREGAEIHYEDNITLIPEAFRHPEDTLVVYTPAVPESHTELTFFREGGFEVIKRARVLGEITNCTRGLCIAGTHGKTTTSSMLAHILKQSHVDCNAFLGGILKNYESNLMLAGVDTWHPADHNTPESSRLSESGQPLVSGSVSCLSGEIEPPVSKSLSVGLGLTDNQAFTVIEADEFDRSFHWLTPYMSVITAADPDHLDIYGTAEAYRESFEKYTTLIRPDGVLVMKKDVDVTPRLQSGVKLYTYSATDPTADFHAEQIRIGNGEIFFDFVGPDIHVADVQLGVPMKVNIENGVAAMAIAHLNGVTVQEMKEAVATFPGPRRRFDFHLKKDTIVLIDDYAHHPAELAASIQSVKELYAGRKVTGIFQPHLYTRTRDFADDFASSLSLLDELILLDIYPAREEPIPGVTSRIIFDKVTIPSKTLCMKEELLDIVTAGQYEVVLMVGAGNIDRMVEPVKEILDKK